MVGPAIDVSAAPHSKKLAHRGSTQGVAIEFIDRWIRTGIRMSETDWDLAIAEVSSKRNA